MNIRAMQLHSLEHFGYNFVLRCDERCRRQCRCSCSVGFECRRPLASADKIATGAASTTQIRCWWKCGRRRWLRKWKAGRKLKKIFYLLLLCRSPRLQTSKTCHVARPTEHLILIVRYCCTIRFCDWTSCAIAINYSFIVLKNIQQKTVILLAATVNNQMMLQFFC